MINWREKDALYSTDLGKLDFSAYKWLSLSIGQNYSADGKESNLNPMQKNQSFTVALADMNGTVSSIVLGDTIERGIPFPKNDQNTFKAALTTFLIPVQDFKSSAPNLSLAEIKELRLQFNRVSSGSIVFDNICLSN